MLRKRIESDMRFADETLRKDFKEFMEDEIILAEAFQLSDKGKPSSVDVDIKRPFQLRRNVKLLKRRKRD